jgi:hypothetical protein
VMMSLRNSSDAIRNRTRDLPACSVVPEPTALPAVSDMGSTVQLCQLVTRTVISLFLSSVLISF